MQRKLIQFKESGFYIQDADVYIDPWRKVDRAIITHGHSDHARAGHKSYLCHHDSVGILRYRLGSDINVQGVAYGECINMNGVKISLHPAGHIVGSAQVRVEKQGIVWVVSGDYKLEDDGLSTAFEPVKCQHFITECTFGLPVFKWQSQRIVMDQINDWWQQNAAESRPSILSAYALGKAQRIINNVNTDIGPILTHGAVENTNEVLREAGVIIKDTIRISPDTPKELFNNALIIATGSSINSAWGAKIKNASHGVASGWMMMRGTRRRYAADRGFVLSDHADWNDLNKAIKETGAQYIYPTHGYTDTFTRWLNDQGYVANAVKTQYEGDEITEDI